MRTTVSIDDDVLLAVRERARRGRHSVGEVLSALAREALTHHYADTHGSDVEPVAFHGFEPFPHRGAAVSNELIDRLREDEAV